MEWIEVTGDSVEDAKSLALEKLGVHDSEADFEVVETPSSKLFGLRKTQARVRARVRPVAPKPKRERGDRRRRSGGSGGAKKPQQKQGTKGRSDGRNRGRNSNQKDAADAEKTGSRAPGGDTRSRPKSQPKPQRQESPVEEVETAVREFLAGLARSFGLDDTPVLVTSDGVIEASLPGREGVLIGPKGRTLDAIQELTRVAAQRAAPSSTRIRVDVGGYRAARGEALGAFARKAAARVREEGTEVVLDPMTAPDRKVVHDALVDEPGISTRSIGEDPRRRVVIVPDGPAPSGDEEE